MDRKRHGFLKFIAFLALAAAGVAAVIILLRRRSTVTDDDFDDFDDFNDFSYFEDLDKEEGKGTAKAGASHKAAESKKDTTPEADEEEDFASWENEDPDGADY